MRLSIDSNVFSSQVRTLVEGSFTSSLPSEATLSRAWSDPALRQYFKPENAPELGRLLQSVAMDAFAHVQARVGTSIGVPGAVLGDFARTIAADALEDGVVNWASFAKSGVQAVTDVALDAMGAVPIVGWIAKAALTVINAIIDAATKEAPRPLLLTYSRDADEDEAQRAIGLIGPLHSDAFYNWNPLFMPASSGQWTYDEAENGYSISPRDDSNGMGGIPSGVMGHRAINVRSWPTILTQVQRAIQFGEIGPESDPLDAKRVRDAIASTTDDVYSQYPSLQRVVLAAWSAASTNYTASCFNMRPSQVRAAWQDYVQNGMSFAQQYNGSAGQLAALSLAVRYRLTYQPIDVRLPPGATVGGVPLGSSASRLRLDLITNAWCDFIERRQTDLLRTPLVAFCSSKQFAFAQNPVLQHALVENRKLFVTTLDADDVDPKDIVDDDFRDAVVSYNGPRSGRMPGKAPSTPHNIPPIVGLPMGGGAAGGGAVLAAMLVGAVWWATKGRR